MTKVYEIASQREPHVSVDPLDIGALIRFVTAFHCY